MAMKKFFRKGPVIIVLFMLLVLPAGYAEARQTIRVLLASGVKTLELSNTHLAERVVIESTQDGRILFNGTAKSLPLRLYPGKGYISMNGRAYHGFIRVYEEGGGIMAVNELGLESYVAGIINNEVSSKWPMEVLKAQAVASRTYALYRKQRSRTGTYDIEGSVLGQVYSGKSGEDLRSVRAVWECKGEILTYRGEPALTVYHSNAGGVTDSAKDIWGRDYPYLKSVASPYDVGATWYSWDFEVSPLSFKGLLNGAGVGVGTPVSITVEKTTAAGRATRLKIVDDLGSAFFLSGEELRKIIGYGVLRSTRFTVEKKEDVFKFKGNGSGHGVGLSQWGAKGMAENGYSYREILDYYYPGTVLERLR